MKVRLPKEDERTHNLFDSKTMNLNDKFIKDGYIYLLRGSKKNLENGITSKLYREGKTLKNSGVTPDTMAMAHVLNGNTAFISTTTSYYVAASFSKKDTIYIVKIPINDIYVYVDDLTISLEESEYLVPDFIEEKEIVSSFKYDDLKSIYLYLKEDIGLNILPEDLNVTLDDLNKIDYEKLDLLSDFNTGGEGLLFDNLLNDIQKKIIKK